MRDVELSDNSMMDLGIMDFKRVSIDDDGTLIFIHIDKFKDRDSSTVLLLRPEEVDKLKEALNEQTHPAKA